MIFENRLYDVLKIISQIVLPAICALYVALAGIWHFPYAEEVAGTVAAVDTFLGALLQISSEKYKKVLQAENCTFRNEDDSAE